MRTVNGRSWSDDAYRAIQSLLCDARQDLPNLNETALLRCIEESADAHGTDPTIYVLDVDNGWVDYLEEEKQR